MSTSISLLAFSLLHQHAHENVSGPVTQREWEEAVQANDGKKVVPVKKKGSRKEKVISDSDEYQVSG